MPTIDVYRTELRRADTKSKQDDVLYRAAQDPQIGTREYKELIDMALGTLDDAVRSIRR